MDLGDTLFMNLFKSNEKVFKKDLVNIRYSFSTIQKVGFISNFTSPNTHCKKCDRRVMTGNDFCIMCIIPPVELKLFLALIQFRSQHDIEMTILHTDQQTAQLEVIDILEQDGYKMGDTLNLVVKEIDGPFQAGFVISRNRIQR